MPVAYVRLLVLFALAFTALISQAQGVSAKGAAVSHESLDFSGCFPDHALLVCAEISGVRHQVVAPNGTIITGFTEFSCFTITSGGEFVSQTCQTEFNAGLTRNGFLTMVHDSGQIEFTQGGQLCSGRFLLQIANGVLIVNEMDIACV
ncbi:MAG: hypothetical protein ACJ789_17110 [Thermomicrobiales bacterium]